MPVTLAIPPLPNESMPRRPLLISVLLITLAVVLFGWWMTHAPRVPALSVRLAPLVRTLQFSARVATFSRVDVGSTVTGRVLRVMVDEGDQVGRGDPLVRLETDELQAALAQAQASERAAEARLAGLRSTGRRAAAAAVAQADAVLAAAQADLERTQALVSRGFLSAARLDDARRVAAVARAQQAVARAQRAANDEQGSEIVEAQAQTLLARSATAAAQARLEQAVLTAPAAARVLARLVEPGQIVQPGRSLLTLALAGPLQLVAQVDERYLEQLAVGQPASVLADAFPSQRFTARVLSIAPLIDAQRGAIEVKFSLPQAPPAFLREDMTLSVEVETARREAALVLPVDALRGDQAAANAIVLVERDGRVEERAVRIGLRTLAAAEVVDGLRAGEVVLRPAAASALKAGSRVRARIIDDGLAASTSSALRNLPHEDAGSAMSNAMGR
ncbi:MAG: efflux RND transporter periplasmic adaptor subunit [Candidatus Accumulibacter sp. UW27]|jgi:HlyD family secretion protein